VSKFLPRNHKRVFEALKKNHTKKPTVGFLVFGIRVSIITEMMSMKLKVKFDAGGNI